MNQVEEKTIRWRRIWRQCWVAP